MKTYYRELFRKSLLALVCGGVVRFERPATANPTGATVAQGNAKFNTQGSQLTIQTAGNTFINWQNFNIAQGETTTFVQPSATSLVWNHITDANPSQILGNLNANGYVVLQNQSGFFIGGTAAITAHGLIMTTSPIAMPDLSSGGAWSFNVPPPASKIINYGKIDLDKGGSVFLIANVIKNHGTIEAPEGDVGLYAGKQVLVSDRPDGLGLSAAVTLPSGSVDNTGKIIADAGTIAMNARVVNQGGLLQANSAREVGGTIELIASDAVNLGAKSVIDAQGDAGSVSDGGSVTIKSSGTFTDKPTSSINISGGANGGNGGQVEISAPRITSINSQIDGHAASGYTAGTLSIDPDYIVLVDDTSATQAPSSGTVSPSDPPSAGSADTLTLDINSFNSLITKNMLSQINLQANLDIELASVWNIPDSTTINSSLTLNAGRNIIVDNNAGIEAGKNWSLNFSAGTALPANTIPASGNYGIYLNGNGFLATQNGNINLSAANEVQANIGYIPDPTNPNENHGLSTAGGNITVTTTYGDIHSGSVWNLADSTGNSSVTLTAGGNITFDDGSGINAGKNYALNLTAGTSLAANTTPTSGNDGIYLNGNSYLATINGNINLSAANEVDLNESSDIRTTSGGNIAVTTTYGDIYSSSTWNLPDRPLNTTINSTLTLNAGQNIVVDNNGGINGGAGWTLNLNAGTALAANTTPTAGEDGVYLYGNAFIAASDKNITIFAPNEVQVDYGDSGAVGSGIRTTGGGSIKVTTTYGDINAGYSTQGYLYTSASPYYSASKTVGGISTAAGGDVTISAGGNVYSYLPTSTTQNSSGDAGSGAFDPTHPGNVTVTAGTSGNGGSVYGHFVEGDGTGKITAIHGDIGGPASANVALSLINGSWTLDATSDALGNAGDIYLQEVRNPNGVFNDKSKTSKGFHKFDYASTASVTLDADDAVYLTDSNVPRNANEPVLVLYPPTLDISAGKGGVVLENNVTLFPSKTGDLTITTTDNGNLVTQPADTINNPDPELVMSDSDQTQWTSTTSFSDTDHGTALLESQNTAKYPAYLDISGSMENFLLLTTAATYIHVAGDMLDCGFSGQNLSSGDTTTIKIDGQIKNDSPYTFLNNDVISIPSVPNQNLPPGTLQSFTTALALAIDPVKLAALTIPVNLTPAQLLGYVLANASLLGGNPGFLYDPSTGRLGYTGAMSPSVQTALDSPLTLLRLDANGFPILDANGKFVTDQLTWVSKAQIDELAQNSAGAPSAVDPAAQLGYRIGGPGAFVVTASSISLGNTDGILSCGVGDPSGGFGRYGNLASVTTDGGATLTVTANGKVGGDISLLTSTIATLGGGDLTVTSDYGTMDFGSQDLFGTTGRDVGFGIFTTGGGNVNVTALGDINIDGSRIATYNGGKITVLSQQGNVNVGNGGASFISVPVFFVKDGVAGVYAEQVFGSGIVANTLVNPKEVPGAATIPGDIDVRTPQGSILASSGGITQEALNGNISGGPMITLIAGTDPVAATATTPAVPGYVGNIDLGNSGVIGGTVNLKANGNITGLIISRQDSTIDAAASFSGTVLSGGSANLSAGGSISGTVVGIGGVNANGGQGVTATLLGQNVSVGGAAATSTLGTSATASATSQAAAQQANTDSQQQVASNPASDDDDLKKKAKGPMLRRMVGRVTVLLP